MKVITMDEMNTDELIATIWPDEHNRPTRVIHCRHCNKKNEVDVATAVFNPEKYECGSCGKDLFLNPEEPLTDIASSAFEHSLDKKSLAALRAIPGFPQLVRWLLKNLTERVVRLQLMSSNILCTEEQFPEMLGLLQTARSRLDLVYEPEIYIGESPFLNAMTTGVDKPVVVMHSALAHQATDAELVCVIGHELGHLHTDHILYKTLAALLITGGMTFSGLARLLTWPIQKALLKWDRCSELSADRAGLLACRDLKASLGLLLKMAGGHSPVPSKRYTLKLGPFVKQARELARMESANVVDNVMAVLLSMNMRHPYTAWRVMHLLQWVEHGDYLAIMAGHYERR
jgi:Zn-dependent protease with chaperone function